MRITDSHPCPTPGAGPHRTSGSLRRPTPRPMTNVALAVQHAGAGRYVYCACGADVELAGRVTAAGTHIAVLEAVIDVVRREPRRRIRFGVRLPAGSPLWRHRPEIEALLPGALIEFATCDDALYLRIAHTRIAAELAPPAPTDADFTPVTVATDGSVRGSITGYGWLASTGEYGLLGFPHRRRQIGTDPVLVAELRAIDAAVSHIRHAPMTIVSDSRSAVRMVHRWMAGDCVLPDGYTTDRRSGQAGLVLAQNRIHAQRTRIDVRWQRGHQGDPLNEGADALARLASRRLASKGELSAAEYHQRAAGLATAFAAAFRHSAA